MNTRNLNRLREKQHRLASKVVLKDSFKEVMFVGGVDVAYTRDYAYGAIVVLNYDTLKEVETKTTLMKTPFPYIPTYLSYREYPIIGRLYKKLDLKPDVLLVDGNGILHPHHIGLASHTGVLLDIPTIGVAKSLLCGRVNKKGEVRLNDKTIGYALKKNNAKPVYVSPGHRISLKTSLEITKKLCRTRIPEPIKLAHTKANKLKTS